MEVCMYFITTIRNKRGFWLGPSTKTGNQVTLCPHDDDDSQHTEMVEVRNQLQKSSMDCWQMEQQRGENKKQMIISNEWSRK